MMMLKHRSFILCLLIFNTFLTYLSASFCFNSSFNKDQDETNPCFLEKPIDQPIILHSFGNTLVLPCHVARSTNSIIEWWFTDTHKMLNLKIYPVFPIGRPMAIPFVTSLTTESKILNETDIVDASILLRHVNIDDSGTYSCIIRPINFDRILTIEEILSKEDSQIPILQYQIHFKAPRLCQSSLMTLPCFSLMRSSSPTIIDAYQITYLQCVVNSFNRPVNVFWVVGNETTDSVLITDYLTKNHYHGDRLRRINPLSSFDYSIELILNQTIDERIYSCVIDGATEIETTLFTYIVRNIEPNSSEKIKIEKKVHSTVQDEKKLIPHDDLGPSQIDLLHQLKKEKHHQEPIKDEIKSFDILIRNTTEEISKSR